MSKQLCGLLGVMALAGCGAAPGPTTIVKCPIKPPDPPAIEWSDTRPATEHDLQTSWLTGRAAYEEAIETLDAWNSLWGAC